MPIIFKENNIKYGQNFRFFEGIPAGIKFYVNGPMLTRVRLIADGYGFGIHKDYPGNYGNGAIFVNLSDLAEEVKNQIEIESRIIKRNQEKK